MACGLAGVGGALRETPTKPTHGQRIRGCLKTAPAGMRHIQNGGPIVPPDKALVLCDIPEIHGGEGGGGSEGEGGPFSHTGAQSHRASVSMTHAGRGEEAD